MFPSLSDYPQPLRNPDRLTTSSLVGAVYLQYFKELGAAPERPFFIVQRSLEYYPNTACVRRIPNLLIERQFYAGITGSGELLQLSNGMDRYEGTFGVLVGTDGFVRLSEQGGEHTRECGTLLIGISSFGYTSYLSPMRDPQTGRDVWAFSVAIGLRQMETLALAEPCVGYLEAAQLLKLPIVSEEMQRALRVRKETILSELLHCHARAGEPKLPEWKTVEFIRDWVRKARAIGMHEDYAQVAVNGIRYRPAEVLEDLAHLYRGAAAP